MFSTCLTYPPIKSIFDISATDPVDTISARPQTKVILLFPNFSHSSSLSHPISGILNSFRRPCKPCLLSPLCGMPHLVAATAISLQPLPAHRGRPSTPYGAAVTEKSHLHQRVHTLAAARKCPNPTVATTYRPWLNRPWRCVPKDVVPALAPALYIPQDAGSPMSLHAPVSVCRPH